MIEEYEMTEKIPLEIVYSNKSKYKMGDRDTQKGFLKYSEKYDFAKNFKYSNQNNTENTIEHSGIIHYILLTLLFYTTDH